MIIENCELFYIQEYHKRTHIIIIIIIIIEV
jgi:hypothetical protein